MSGINKKDDYFTISSILGEIISSSDSEKIFRQIVRLAMQTSGGQEASLFLRNQSTGKLEIVAQKGKPVKILREARKMPRNAIASWVMKYKKPVILKGDLKGTQFEAYAKKRRIVSSLCIPLIKGKRATGALSINCTDTARPFKKNYLGKAQILATVSAAAIHHANLQRKLKKQYIRLKEEHQNVIRYQNQAMMAERLTSLGIMAASIAHELKSPVTTVLTYAELLKNQSLPEDLKERGIAAIFHEAERMSNIFKHLLDFSRQDKAPPETTEINELIKNTLIFTEHHLSRFEQVSVVTRLQPNLPPVYIDKGQIQQVFVNMILNAAQAMSKGVLHISSYKCLGKEIELFVPQDYYEFSNDQEFICAEFKDNGPGISPKNVDQLFKPFFTTKKRGQGTGLGLFISKNIVESFSGFIHVDPNPGKGASFSIYLPVTNNIEDTHTKEYSESIITSGTDSDPQVS